MGWFEGEGVGPYLAPCVLLSLPSFVTFLAILLFLPETHASRAKNLREMPGDAVRAVAAAAAWGGRRVVGLGRGRVGSGAGADDRTLTLEGGAAGGKLGFLEKIKIIRRDPLMWTLMVANGLISFSNGFFFPGFVLFLSSRMERHGMGFNERQTGIAFTVMGAVGFVFQARLSHRHIRQRYKPAV